MSRTPKHACTLTGQALILMTLSCAASANLIINGDFEAGNSGFSSDYNYSPGNIFAAGVYDVVTDPRSVHTSAASYGDHTTGTGNMMVVNGSTTSGDVVWGQTLTVLGNTSYDFAAYISTWVAYSPAALEFTINGTSIGSLTAPATTGSWDLVFSTWNSGSLTSANIEIRNANIAFGGNDFALDDIYFGTPIFSDPEAPSPVSEPGVLALLFIGVAGLTLSTSQRRARSST